MTEHSGRFAIIPSRALDDQRIGNAAFKVLAALGSYADRDGWCWPSYGTLAQRFGVSDQAIAKQLKELRRLGYIEIVHRHRANGSLSSNGYRLIHDADLATLHDRLSVSTSGSQGSTSGSQGGQPDVGRGSTSEVGRGSTSGMGAEERNQLTSHLTDTRDRTLLEEFQTFWRSYPSRRPHSRPRKPALKSFTAAVKHGAAAAEIIRGAENFAEHVRHEGGDPRYIPMPATWLNQERWADFQEAPAKPEPMEIAPL